MALPGTLLVRLRAVCNLGKYVERRSKAGLNVTDVRWYKTNPRSLQDSTPPVKQGECRGHIDPVSRVPGTHPQGHPSLQNKHVFIMKTVMSLLLHYSTVIHSIAYPWTISFLR